MWMRRFDKRVVGSTFLAFVISAPAFLWQMLFFVVPLCVVALLSFVSWGDCGHVHGITGSFYAYFLTPLYFRIICRSFALALTNALLCLFIAYPLAYFLAFRVGRLKHALLVLLILPFWINFLLHVYAWYFVLDHGGLVNTILLQLGLITTPLPLMNSLFSIVIMMVYYYLPFMALPLYIALEKFDWRLIEASLDLGATWWQTFRKVMLPLTFPGILSGFFLVFVPSFAEFAIPELMGGDTTLFAGSVISYFVISGVTISYGAAFTIISSCLLLVGVGVLYVVIKKVMRLL